MHAKFGAARFHGFGVMEETQWHLLLQIDRWLDRSKENILCARKSKVF